MGISFNNQILVYSTKAGFDRHHSPAGCGKTPVRAGFGKGTSSTRAATAAKSTVASSRWGNAALKKTISAAC